MNVAGHMLLRKSLNRPEIHPEVSPFNVRFSLKADLMTSISGRSEPRAKIDIINRPQA